MKFWECLPTEVSCQLRNVQGLREVRLRDGKPIRVNIEGRWFWSGKQLLASPTGAIVFDRVCENFIRKACNSSVYAYEKMLAHGFFTMSDGCRIGVCGEMSGEGVFKNYTSLCIRIARNVSCAQLFDKSVLIAGPPCSGKTTFLRDLANKLSTTQNVVVVDERGEISCCDGFENGFCDVFLYTPKKYAFETATRAMSPDWVICDELSAGEISLLRHAEACGVNVAASIHAENYDDVESIMGNSLASFKYLVLMQRDTFKQTVTEISSVQREKQKNVENLNGRII